VKEVVECLIISLADDTDADDSDEVDMEGIE
jgi:hypothetical protein